MDRLAEKRQRKIDRLIKRYMLMSSVRQASSGDYGYAGPIFSPTYTLTPKKNDVRNDYSPSRSYLEVSTSRTT